MGHFEEPPPRPKRSQISLQDALNEVRQKPGEWYFVKDYLNSNTAGSCGRNLRLKNKDIETRIHGRKLYLRAIEV